MQQFPRSSNSSNNDFEVRVLDEQRLRSELAMFVWAQTESWRSQQRAAGGGPSADAEFKIDKQSLTETVVSLAGQVLSRADLIERLRLAIVGGRSSGLHGLDPKTLAAKISVRARG